MNALFRPKVKRSSEESSIILAPIQMANKQTRELQSSEET